MNSAEKKLFIKKLATEDDSQLINTLQYFRKNSDVELIPEILKILDSNRNQETKDAVLQLCLDIKAADAAIELFDFMHTSASPQTRKTLLSIIWQINQDLSIRAAQTAEIMLQAQSFETAFDCLTILENCTDNLSAESADPIIKKLQSGRQSAHPEITSIIESAIECLAGKIMDQD